MVAVLLCVRAISRKNDPIAVLCKEWYHGTKLPVDFLLYGFKMLNRPGP